MYMRNDDIYIHAFTIEESATLIRRGNSWFIFRLYRYRRYDFICVEGSNDKGLFKG